MSDTIFGYTFRDPSLLEEALTTPSYRMSAPDARDNQRLEFLGDAVLDFLAADQLYAESPEDSEGTLTVKRTHMVSSPALCDAAARHGLAARLRRNKGAEPLPPGAKTFADAVEAIIGAAWLDGGLDAARKVFEALELETNAEGSAWSGNPKGDLQVRVQAMTPPRHPEYTLLDVAGKSHEPIFTVKVSVDGVGEETARARTRKEAESAAAAKLLSRILTSQT
ncbi:MAG: ribonuclease III [Kiritimatiellae bacterium]|nr:ribonuclease III [Kiritimatiellia bacterium]